MGRRAEIPGAGPALRTATKLKRALPIHMCSDVGQEDSFCERVEVESDTELFWRCCRPVGLGQTGPSTPCRATWLPMQLGQRRLSLQLNLEWGMELANQTAVYSVPSENLKEEGRCPLPGTSCLGREPAAGDPRGRRRHQSNDAKEGTCLPRSICRTWSLDNYLGTQ